MLRRSLYALVVASLVLGQQCGQTPNPDPDDEEPLPRVKLVTSKGNLVIELFTTFTPAAVKFKELVEAGYYTNTLFHEVQSGKWIIGGQYNESLTPSADQGLVNDSTNGLINLKGRVAVYGPDGSSTGVPHFLINLADNSGLDYSPGTGERVDYTVIGRLVDEKSQTVATTIGALPTTSQTTSDGVALDLIPQENVVISEATVGQGLQAEAGADQVALLNREVTLDGSESETFGNDDLTYQWTQTGGTEVTLTDADAASAKFTPAGTGTYTFKLVITDTSDKTDNDSINVIVYDKPNVRLQTSKGDIVLEMYEEGSPISVTNFLQYVHDGFYNGTIFHRVISSFVVQGGGFLPDLARQSGLRDPIVNEFDTARPNRRGTISLARTTELNSATSQFFLNLVDNTGLDTPGNGYAVFGKVVEGMNVVDDIARVATETRQDPDGNEFENVPVEDILINSATIEARPAASEWVTTASGLQYKDITIGSGALVQPTDTVSVYYVGRLTDESGEIFDSSGDTKQDPSSFPLDGVIQGWTEGLGGNGMRVGGTRQLIIPPELGYGEDGYSPDIPPNATLFFEVEVVEVVEVFGP